MKIIFFFLITCFSISGFSQNGKPASTLFQNALLEAKASKKNIIVVFTATWCGPCKDMHKLLNDDDTRDLFKKSYVQLELYDAEIGENVKDENPGTDSLITTYDADPSSVPFWMILDEAGTKLYDSYEYKREKGIKTRSNAGFSLTAEYLKDFLRLIRKTSQLSTEEINAIYNRGMQLSKLKRDQY